MKEENLNCKSRSIHNQINNVETKEKSNEYRTYRNLKQKFGNNDTYEENGGMNNNINQQINNGINNHNINNHHNQNNDQRRNHIDYEKNKKIRLWIIILIIIAGVAVIFCSVFFPIYLKQKNNRYNIKDRDIENTSGQYIIEEIEDQKKIELLKAFEPKFRIKTINDTLTQLLLKSLHVHKTKSNGIESSYSIFSKEIYDIYTLNESIQEENNAFYSTKYTTAITVNSICSKFSFDSSDNDCKLEKYLDLNTRKTKNLRNNEESKFNEIINEIIIPICIFEHTDTNLILSVKCPKTLSGNIKEDIILAFKTIKPESIKGLDDDKEIADSKIEEKGDKIYIDIFDKICEDDTGGDPTKNISCEIIKNIVTDEDGKLISSKRISTKEILMDLNNSYSYNLTYIFEDISNTSDNFKPENYKSNLYKVNELIKSILKKDDFLSKNSFDQILDFLKKEENNDDIDNNIRNLSEEESNYFFDIKEGAFFQRTINNVPVSLSLKNNIGLEKLSKSETISTINIDEKSQIIYQNGTNMKLNETLNSFVSLTNAGNKMANELYNKINQPLLDLRDKIYTSIYELNNLLAYKDLQSIFDLRTIIYKLDNISYDFISHAQNLYNGINDINNNLPLIIKESKQKLNSYITNFLYDSHDLIYNIFSNLTETTNALASKKSKIAEISSYYLNYTDTSYTDIIKEAKNILDNYYINEANIIVPNVSEVIKIFTDNVLTNDIKEIQNNLDIIIFRLKNDSLVIDSANKNDYENVIEKLNKTKIIFNEIIGYVPEKFYESMNLQSNGYFETDNYIEEKNNTYGIIGEKALNISYTLDNNEIIDKKFDEIMIYLREQFTVLLNNMDKSKREYFPLKEDILGNTLFNSVFVNKIDKFFEDEYLNILKNIREENNNYVNESNNHFNNFHKENGDKIEQLINYLDKELSIINIENIDKKFNEAFCTAKDSINKIIENNKNIAVGYINSFIQARSTHLTQCFINKYNNFINSFSQIKIFIQNNFKNNFATRYKKAINEIRTILQTIKSNKCINKYYNQLNFSESHLTIVQNILDRFGKNISDELFNNNYLPKINEYITSTINNLNQIEQNLKILYNSVSSKTYSSNVEYDYYLYLSYSYRCCKFKLGICWKHKTCTDYYYQGYKLGNDINLEAINFDVYINNFVIYYNNIYINANNYINSYNKILNDLNVSYEAKKHQMLNKDNNFLKNISEQINFIINDKLGKNLLISVYIYYQNEINQSLIFELNEILEQWKSLYDKIYNDVNANKKKFKSSFNEIYLMESNYLSIYYQRIAIDHTDSIINQYKNDLNYTIKYYYNYILYKINKTYSLILNKIPKSEKPFDELLNKREKEIKQSNNEFLNKIQKSRNEILLLKNQLSLLSVNDNDFFNINSYLVKHIEDIKQQLQERLNNIQLLAYDNLKEVSKDIVAARFYLENSQNAKQIIDNYNITDRATFIDLQNSVCKQLFKKFWEINPFEFINNVRNILKDSNETLLNSFKLYNEKMKVILENKINKEIYTKEELSSEINNIYSNGLKALDINSKNIIEGYLDEIIYKIKSIISYETSKLSEELSSYSNKVDKINNTINNYKEFIYNKIISTITSPVEEFYENINNKFYKDYIEKYLDEYKDLVISENFQEDSILNISFNLNNILYDNITFLINNYKRYAREQINYLNEKNKNKLDELFSFTKIKNKIYNEINIEELLNIIKNMTNSGYDTIIDYDLPNQTEIYNFILEKMNQTKKIIDNMNNNNFNINYNRKIPDFNSSREDVFEPLKNNFDDFIKSYNHLEIKKFNDSLLEYINFDFKIITEKFVPSFGKDFFDRILYYNEVQKIKSLYNNLYYCLIITKVYYASLCSLYSIDQAPIYLPEDVKLKIITLNNFDSTVKIYSNTIIKSLESKLDDLIDETIEYTVNNYIFGIQNNLYIKLNFTDEILNCINGVLNSTEEKFKNEYKNMINKYIKNPFIEKYTETLNEKTNEILDYIETNREQIRLELDKIFTLNSDSILAGLNSKLDNTKKSVQAYISYIDNFKISSEIYDFLKNFGKDIIYPKYKDINDMLDKITEDLRIKNLEQTIINSENYKKEYIFKKFEKKVNEINENLTYDFKEFNKSLANYGITYNNYRNNLIKEKEKNNNRSELEESKNEEKVANLQLDNIFQELKNSLVSLKLFMESFQLFNDFEKNINEYINETNYQSIILDNMLLQYEEYYNELNPILIESKNLSLDYYLNATILYHRMKNTIIDSINIFEELLNNSTKITFKVINEEYIDIKNKFIPINETIKKDYYDINIEDYTINNTSFQTSIDKNIINNKFNLELLFEESELIIPEVKGKIINNNKLENFEINSYIKVGACGNGMKINPKFNNVTLSTEIYYSTKLNRAIISTILFYDQYDINIHYYEDKLNNNTFNYDGMWFPQALCQRHYLTNSIEGYNLYVIGPNTKKIIQILDYNN